MSPDVAVIKAIGIGSLQYMMDTPNAVVPAAIPDTLYVPELATTLLSPALRIASTLSPSKVVAAMYTRPRADALPTRSKHQVGFTGSLHGQQYHRSTQTLPTRPVYLTLMSSITVPPKSGTYIKEQSRVCT
jgi:hypothetical protein